MKLDVNIKYKKYSHDKVQSKQIKMINFMERYLNKVTSDLDFEDSRL